MRVTASLVVVALAALGDVRDPFDQRQAPAQTLATANTATIAGQVVDDAGRAVAGAIVNLGGPVAGATTSTYTNPGVALVLEPGVNSASGLDRVMADAQGRFLFQKLAPGRYTMTASKAGFLAGGYGRLRSDGLIQGLDLARAARADVRITMWRPAAIWGTVRDEAGDPLVGIPMRAFRRVPVSGRQRFTAIGSVFTDDRGAFRFAGLVPGEYLVAVSGTQATRRRPDSQSFTVRSDGNGIVFRESPTDQLTDRSLVVGSNELSSATGTFPRPGDGRLFTYPTTFFPAGQSAREASSIRVSAGDDRGGVDFRLMPVPTVTVSGVIAYDGFLPSLSLQLLPADDGNGAEVPVATTTAQNDGSFVFLAVPACHCALGGVASQSMIQGDGTVFFAVRAPVDVGGTDRRDVRIAPDTGATIAGRLQFDGASPLPTAERMQQIAIAIDPAESSPLTRALIGRVAADGRFSVTVPSGRYYVRIGGGAGNWILRSATLEGRDITDTPMEVTSGSATGVIVTMTDRKTQLGGDVRTEGGGPDGGASVLLFPAEEARRVDGGPNVRRVRFQRVMSDGRYGFGLVPPGDYFLAAIPDRSASGWYDAEFLGRLSSVAMSIHLVEGETRRQTLHTVEVPP